MFKNVTSVIRFDNFEPILQFQIVKKTYLFDHFDYVPQFHQYYSRKWEILHTNQNRFNLKPAN